MLHDHKDIIKTHSSLKGENPFSLSSLSLPHHSPSFNKLSTITAPSPPLDLVRRAAASKPHYNYNNYNNNGNNDGIMATGGNSYSSSLPSSLLAAHHHHHHHQEPPSQSFSRNSGTTSGNSLSNDGTAPPSFVRKRSSILRRGNDGSTQSSLEQSGGGGGVIARGCCGGGGGGCCFCCGWTTASSPPPWWCEALRSVQRSERRKIFFIRVLYSRWWRSLSIIFTFVLLFGGPVRWLVVPKVADDAIDYVFLLAFCFFCLDIIMRMDSEPRYFPLSLVFCIGDNLAVIDGGHNDNSSKGCCGCEFGSFLFWCDIVSTLTLLHEISFVNRRNFEIQEVGIRLDKYGFPSTGLEEINESVPFELEISLLVSIARTARVARFIRSSTAVKISSKVDWYWYLSLINPISWFEACQSKVSRTINDRSHNHHHAEMGGGADSAEHNVSKADGGSAGAGKRGQRGGKEPRKQSWTNVGMGVLAAVKTKAMMEQQKRKRGLFNPVVDVLRRIGILHDHEEEFRRQLAATRIQRAWRAARRRQAENNDDGYDNTERSEHDLGRSGRNHHYQASNNNRNNTPTERALEKRSFMIQSSMKGDKGKFGAGTGGGRSNSASRSDIASSATRFRQEESQVGSAMRELTGQRVAVGIIVALVLVAIFTYGESDVTRHATMVVLHNQTAVPAYVNRALAAARMTSARDLFVYELANGTALEFDLTTGEDWRNLRPRETLNILVRDESNGTTAGYFAFVQEKRHEAAVSLLATVFILLTWLFGVTAFAGPVMILVVIPIERMVRLLGMLMMDPLGYQSTSRYKRFVIEEDEITKNTRWTKEVLKGMETSFLMSTILRIGSLMKVGFGSAGVEIIRRNLEKGHSKNQLILSSQGSTVSCIFLFCDIRQFTDATECLQEEVFVFTNRVAAVVHSYCNAYGGSANKNIGDAFLVSWLLEEKSRSRSGGGGFGGGGFGGSSNNNNETFTAKKSQADKALLAVVKITMALHHDDFYVEKLGPAARDALLAKLAKRKGPVVQMGCGLHAGRAVQGAIGSQRKIDATYVSEAVERAEFLESSTKMYGVKMLMSDSFHRLLHPNNRRRCRKVDQIIIKEDDDDDDDDDPLNGDIMELLTFDMDIDALWKKGGASKKRQDSAGYESDSAESGDNNKVSKRGGEARMMPSGITRAQTGGGIPFPAPALRTATTGGVGGGGGSSIRPHPRLKGTRRMSMGVLMGRESSDELSQDGFTTAAGNNPSGGAGGGDAGEQDEWRPPELVLPTGPALYNSNVWVSEEMRRIRQLYIDGLFFQKFNSGLQAFYSKDWDNSAACFQSILERFEDGPSRYFLNQIQKNNGVPPRDFCGYGRA